MHMADFLIMMMMMVLDHIARRRVVAQCALRRADPIVHAPVSLMTRAICHRET